MTHDVKNIYTTNDTTFIFFVIEIYGLMSRMTLKNRRTLSYVL